VIRENHHRPLGGSGIKVSSLGTGTNRWAQGKNDEAVFQAYQSLLDAGVNFFDTAEVYSKGKSERLLGACLHRDNRPVVIASKFAPLPTRLSRRQFMNALDASLSRLEVQTIDLYYIHFPFSLLSVETLMDMMAQAVEAGKIRAVGVSNFNAAQMRRAVSRLARYNIPLAANQVRYNLLNRQPEENGVLDACRELNVALVAYRPLEGGRLKSNNVRESFSSGSPSPTADEERLLHETLQRIALQRGKSVSQVALNWLLRRDEHVIPIPGATSDRHALENADTLTWELSDDEFRVIDQVSSTWKRYTGRERGKLLKDMAGFAVKRWLRGRS
jgi:aryl-alcohol dehydrogenase-like predicted oxidoreductase